MVSAQRASGSNPTANREPALAGSHTSPLTAHLVASIGSAWNRGADFAALADQVVDVVSEHIRRFGITGVDARLAHAIADAITDHAEADYAPVEAPGQLTIDDVVGRGCRACRDARRTAERGWCGVCDGAWPIDDRSVAL